MPELLPPFIVSTSFRLPGLGVLVLPTLPEPSWLASHPLHTALTIVLPRDDQPSTAPLVGTIEEIQHADSPPQRALLLDLDANTTLSAGARLIASKVEQYLA